MPIFVNRQIPQRVTHGILGSLKSQIEESTTEKKSVTVGCGGSSYVIIRAVFSNEMMCELQSVDRKFFIYLEPNTGLLHLSMESDERYFHVARLEVACGGVDAEKGKHTDITPMPELPIWFPVEFEIPNTECGVVDNDDNKSD